MTTAQKVIKYIATAFAAFLVVTILSAILSGTYGLMSALGLVKTEENIITEELKVIGSEINHNGTDENYLDIDGGIGEKIIDFE